MLWLSVHLYCSDLTQQAGVNEEHLFWDHRYHQIPPFSLFFKVSVCFKIRKEIKRHTGTNTSSAHKMLLYGAGIYLSSLLLLTTAVYSALVKYRPQHYVYDFFRSLFLPSLKRQEATYGFSIC